MGQTQKKHALANAEKTIKPKGAASRRPPWGLLFYALAKACFFWIWPILIFWALARAYFLGFGPRLFYLLLFLAVAGASPGYF